MDRTYIVLTNSSAGLYNFREELLGELCRNDQVLVSAPVDEYCKDLEQMGCRMLPTEISRRGINPIAEMGLILRYLKLLKVHKPDMAITYTIKPNIYGSIACRMKKIPYAVNITGLGSMFQQEGLMQSIAVFLYRIALKKAKVVFFENKGNMQLFLDKKIVTRQQCCALNGAGVNLERFYFAPYPEHEQVRFLYMGRIMREKGIGELLEAMERLHQEGENCRLDVLGSYEEDYSQRFEDCRRQGWLFYHGSQADVRPFVKEASCFVLPSYHEGMANTNLECAAMGRPLITSDIPGCREAVVENQSGLLCQPRDADSLYNAMKQFLRMTNEDKIAMGRAGRRHMERVFDKRTVVKNTVNALKQ